MNTTVKMAEIPECETEVPTNINLFPREGGTDVSYRNNDVRFFYLQLELMVFWTFSIV